MRPWNRRSCSASRHAEPVLDQDDPGADEHPLELRAGAVELLDLLRRREAHHPLDAGAVVPAAVEQDHLAGGGQVRDVALEVPLGPLALGGRGQRDDPRDPRAEAHRDRLDRAALPGGVAALEDDDDLEAARLHPLLELGELDLERRQLRVVDLALELRPGRMAGPRRRRARRRPSAPVASLVVPLALGHRRVSSRLRTRRGRRPSLLVRGRPRVDCRDCNGGPRLRERTRP